MESGEMINTYKSEEYEGDEYADKRVTDNLIKEFQDEVERLDNVVKRQNELINELKLWEKQITFNFIFLENKIRVNNEDNILLEEGFKKGNEKLLKQIRVNKANHFLLEIKFDELVSKVKLIERYCRN